MANTFVKIASSTVASGGVLEIDFTSIPNTYTDLVLRVSGRSERTNSFPQEFQLTVNNSTTSALYQYIAFRSIATGSAVSEEGTPWNQFGMPTQQGSANTFGDFTVYLASYTDINIYTPMQAYGVTENNSNSTYIYFENGFWNATNAITSVKLTGTSGHEFYENSTVYLYGIKNA